MHPLNRATFVVTATLLAAIFTASYSDTASAKSLNYRLYKLKERVVQKTGMNATLNHSWKMKNGVRVQQKNVYLRGKKHSTQRTFNSAKGNRTRTYNSATSKSVEKVRKLNNGTTARWYNFQSKVTPYAFKQKEVKGTRGGMTRETKYASGTTVKAKRWTTPTSVLGVNTIRDGKGRVTWLRRLGGALPAGK